VLLIVFRLEDDRYALDAARIVEILPFVGIRKLLRLPPLIAGLLNYRGAFVPVIDFSELACGRPALRRMSTRIVLAHCPEDEGETRLLGLVAEQATETLRCDAGDFVSSGIATKEAAFLGPVLITPGGLVQRIELDRLLPPAMREMPLEAFGRSQ
jgi:chemotaxis-related protein WspB